MQLLLAALLGASVGFNTDRNRRPAGMRLYATMSLVGALMSTISGPLASPVATPVPGPVLLSCSLVVGLISLGLILQQKPYSRPTPGLTAAASLVLASVIGLAAGRGLWSPAVMTAVIAFVLLKGGSYLRQRSRRQLENPR